MSMSMETSTLNSQKAIGQGFNKRSKFKLPTIATPDAGKLPVFGKRFNSVKNRTYLNRSNHQPPVEETPMENQLPTSFRSVSEALNVAIFKKKKSLERTEEENKEEAHIKKLIKIKNPKEYHGIGLAMQETLTGKLEEQKKDKRFVHGKSYVISVSPSIKDYSEKKKKKLVLKNPLQFAKKDKHEFKVEELYENKAVARKIRYKHSWHPIFCQSATLTNLNGNLYLIGGVSHAVVKQV